MMNKALYLIALSLFVMSLFCLESNAQVEEDFDSDRDVDGYDFATLMTDFGRENCDSPSTCNGDIHPHIFPDGDVDQDDLRVFAKGFGRLDDGGSECLVLGDSIGAATHTNDACHDAIGDHKELMDCLESRLGSHDPDWSYLGGSKSWSIAKRLCNGKIHNTSRDGDEWKDALDRSMDPIQTGQIGQVIINLGSNDVCAEYNHNYGSLAFVQSTTPGGFVSIEAEHFIQRVAGANHRWETENPGSGASITAVQCQPNNATSSLYPEYLTSGPRMDYRVNFTTTGIHYIWIRGYATGLGDNSVHLGLDGHRQESAERISLDSLGEWAWSGTTDIGRKAYIDIPTTGVHTLNIYMHEDGFRLDKVVMTTGDAWIPSGDGPAENGRGIIMQTQSDGGLISIEAEYFHHAPQPGTHHWEPTFIAGYSGGAAVTALPDSGAVHDLASGPRLDYNVNFKQSGTHYVWVRGYAADPGDDSVYVGVDGENNGSGSKIAINTYRNWVWSNLTTDQAIATIYIPTLGIHTVNLWMNKDGIVLDKIILTRDSIYQPAGPGPDERWENDLGRIAAHIDDTLMHLIENLPLSGKIFWSGIFDITKFHDLMRNRKHDHTFKKCRYLWNLDFDSDALQGDAKDSLCKGELGYFCDLLPDGLRDELLDLYLEQFLNSFDADAPCGRILDDRHSQADRDEARRFNKALNDLMEQKAHQYQGRGGIDINFTQILWYSSDIIRPYFISRIDCYHPNRVGQLKLAQTIWQGHQSDYWPTDEYFFDGFDDANRCTQEFTGWDSCWYDGGDGQCDDEFICSVDASGWYKFGKETNNKDDHWLARDVKDLSDKSEIWIYFKHKRDKFDNDDMDWVKFRVWNGSSWNTVETFREDNDEGNHCSSYYNLTNYKNASPFRIQFKTNNSRDMKNGDKLMFDDFTVFAW